jgi:proteasome accessory factor A
MSRQVEFDDITKGMIPFFVTRQVIAGAGKVGSENGTEPAEFQITQRADFFETEVGLSTMVARPIINTRDEPHADEKYYRRFHVIVGDSNMSEFSIYLKVGITAIALKLIEKGVIGSQFDLVKPVSQNQMVSRDLTCKKNVLLEDGRRLTPIEIQRSYLDLAHKHLQPHEITSVMEDVMTKWEFVLDQLETDPMSLDQHLDWAIKKRIIDAFIERHSLNW